MPGELGRYVAKMVLAADIKIDGSDELKFVLLPNGLYLMPEDQLADATFSLIWCDNCSDLQAGEWFDTPENVEAMIAAAESGNLRNDLQFLYARDEDMLKRSLIGWRQTLRFLLSRKLPARCIGCGGTNIQQINKSQSTLPTTRQQFTVSNVFASTSIDHRLTILSLDGVMLGEIGRYDVNGNRIDATYSYDILMEILNDASIAT